jgi:hypothetical protein
MEGPSGHTQTYPLYTAQVALENRATVFFNLVLLLFVAHVSYLGNPFLAP